MKKSLPAIFASLLCLGGLSGCISNIRAYVDPGLRIVSYADLNTTRQYPSLGVIVEFQRDGKRYPPATGKSREIVLKVLNKTKLFPTISSGVVGTDARLKIVINNTGGETKGSGAATVFTGGLIGAKTTDRYIISAVYEGTKTQPFIKEYRHAIHAILGSGADPEGLQPVTISTAFDVVVEQVILLLLYDLQQEGIL